LIVCDLPEPVDGVTIVPRAEAFGGAVQDLAQHIPGTIPLIDPYESRSELTVQPET
jgi:hypothetical protein